MTTIRKFQHIPTPDSNVQLTKMLDNLCVNSNERFVAGRAASMGFNLAVKMMEDLMNQEEKEAQELNELVEEALLNLIIESE